MWTKFQWGLWHVGLALVIGVVVFITSSLASWIHMREPGVGSTSQRHTLGMLNSIDRGIRRHHEERDQWPVTLCDVDPSWCTDLFDGWSRPFVYSVRDDGFELYSLGRDGLPGGVGLDADLHSDHRHDEAARMPFRHFFHESETRGNRGPCMMIALIAAVQYLSLQIYERPAPSAGCRQGILLALGVIVGATIVAFLVTPAHIPSGH